MIALMSTNSVVLPWPVLSNTEVPRETLHRPGPRMKPLLSTMDLQPGFPHVGCRAFLWRRGSRMSVADEAYPGSMSLKHRSLARRPSGPPGAEATRTVPDHPGPGHRLRPPPGPAWREIDAATLADPCAAPYPALWATSGYLAVPAGHIQATAPTASAGSSTFTTGSAGVSATPRMSLDMLRSPARCRRLGRRPQPTLRPAA